MSSDSDASRSDDSERRFPVCETVALGDVDPARSRHAGRRSAAEAGDGAVAVGTADGRVRLLTLPAAAERWRTEGTDGSVVSIALAGDLVVCGERGPAGAVRAYDRDSGRLRWRHETAAALGDPQKPSRFFLPFVVDVASDPSGGVYVAARRYERRGDERSFAAAIYAFTPTGEESWRYETDASPIALDADGERVGVAFNRCPGSHRRGLVVLDAETGSERASWDPRAGGERRVGDVSLLEDGVAVASHADYRGYRLDGDAEVRWAADLGRPTERDGETLYAYPNHVHATADGIVFVTGNTYPEEGRQTASRHPREHTAAGYDPDGDRRWSSSVGGFVAGLGTDGDRLIAPGAQNFRTRTASTHGARAFSVADGRFAEIPTDGVAAAAALAGGRIAVVEEPVAYHDGEATRGRYRLHLAGAE